MPPLEAPLAIVTGGSRGLGLEVGRRLARRGTAVILGCRDAVGAEAAVRPLVAQGLPVRVARLDVCAPADVAALAAELAAAGRPIDVLVNNAGIALDGFDATVARRTIDTNYHGAARVTDALLPLCAPTARIVMVSSALGSLSCLSAHLGERFGSSTLTRAELDGLVEDFVGEVGAGTHARSGWPSSAYAVSKAALNALARVLARTLRDTSRVRVNAVCPGWVRTDMGGRGAPRSLEQGARSILWATALGPDGPTGGFFRDGERLPW